VVVSFAASAAGVPHAENKTSSLSPANSDARLGRRSALSSAAGPERAVGRQASGLPP